MGITFITFAELFAPWQAFMGWLAPRPRPRAVPAPVPQTATGEVQQRRPEVAGRPQRVVRVVRVAHQPARMLVSGRMADVCAELDRLAALEAAAH